MFTDHLFFKKAIQVFCPIFYWGLILLVLAYISYINYFKDVCILCVCMYKYINK